jgi:23S rRNA (cytidine1920-2'-O)/16S rRNA (cytidine1409-2'-O)-methyltransferase
MAKSRLDQILVARGLCPSREQAQRHILAGEVKIGTRVASKPAEKVADDASIELKARPRYVSRGGLKLEAALVAFGFDVTGFVCLDVGASTGGFTDCLLERGAARVHAFDVGTNQLAWSLRRDPRVRTREQFNCRYLTPADVGEPVDLAVLDLSFISLTLVLPAVVPCLKSPGGEIVCLIKPQFELAPEQVGRGGIVRDPPARDAAVEKIRRWTATQPSLQWAGLIESPITGTDGNVEFLAWIKHHRASAPNPSD